MDRSRYPDKRKVGYVTLYKRRNEMPVFEAKLDEDTTLYDLLKLFWIVDDYSDFCNKCENGDIKVYDFVKCRGCKIPDFDDNKFLYSKSTIKNQYKTHMRLLLKIFKKECQFHFFREKTKVK